MAILRKFLTYNYSHYTTKINNDLFGRNQGDYKQNLTGIQSNLFRTSTKPTPPKNKSNGKTKIEKKTHNVLEENKTKRI